MMGYMRCDKCVNVEVSLNKTPCRTCSDYDEEFIYSNFRDVDSLSPEEVLENSFYNWLRSNRDRVELLTPISVENLIYYLITRGDPEEAQEEYIFLHNIGYIDPKMDNMLRDSCIYYITSILNKLKEESGIYESNKSI